MTIETVTSKWAGRWLIAGPLLLASIAITIPGCIEDSDCGICDPDNLLLESISGINYASRKIHLLNPECEGPGCPGSFDKGSYFIEEIGPCEQTEEALESPRGAEEFCKISPLVTTFGIEFIFNNLLDPTSIELVRKRPDNPQLFEVYDWKIRVLDIEGPITRFNGDFTKGKAEEPDQVTRLVNLACIDNLRDEGIDYGHEDYEDPATNPCNAIGPNGLPRKLREAGTITSYPGRWQVGGNSCDTPQEGPDTCCTRCDFLLSTQVAKYGLTAPAPEGATLSSLQSEGLARNPNTGTGIICDPAADALSQCADFIPWVSRAEQEIKFRYHWDCNPATDTSCEPKEYDLPYYDQMRETHPDQRPQWLEPRNAACETGDQCRLATGHGLSGSQCVGISGDGLACDPETAEPGTCTNGRCVAEWFVGCQSQTDTTGDSDPLTDGQQGYCVDRRYSDAGAEACLRSRGNNNTPDAPGTFDALCDENGDDCSTAPGGTRLAFCDHNGDGTLLGSECCQASLQTEQGEFSSSCDPFHQDLDPISVYDRSDTLPEPTKNCICPRGGTTWGEVRSNEDLARCTDSIRIGCFEADDIRDNGDGARAREQRAGQYAVKFVSRSGGVIYDPAIKGFEWRPADIGGVPRAELEACAERDGEIRPRNAEDGWRSNDANPLERFEDYDRGLCSDSSYTINFAVPGDGGQFVEDKVGNTLAGKAHYTFQTPEFHVQPGSGFPSDNLRIGACNDFSIRFSNKYDMSPENVAKIEIWKLHDDPSGVMPWDDRFDRLVAGGANCATTGDALESRDAPVPCLTIDVGEQAFGEIGVAIDPTEFSDILKTETTYRLWVPGLSNRGEMADPAAYQRAFWDVCGMPLITTGGTAEPDFLYDFTIDKPKCKEDQDLDGIQISCDNAPDFFNPDQGDMDRDGFGDVLDLCPTLPGSTDDTADSDDDGVGNECDNCRQATRQYNEDDATPMGYMLVRNIPFQNDTDGDGIGDVCDNCVHTANCNEYDADDPWTLGDPIDYATEVLCQLDTDNDMVGDACGGEMATSFAAGPIGIGPTDDFDQDGLTNVLDACPRQPVATVEAELDTCESDDDCPVNRRCETAVGVCDHLDTDADGVGDVCDTCPFVENPLQVSDGAMQEGDDSDGDFVGNACETHPSCESRVDARPLSFYEVSANGYCCTVALFADEDGNLHRNLAKRDEAGNVMLDSQPLLDPMRKPVREFCSEADEGIVCRSLPASVAAAPGILIPPAGCTEALAGLDPRENIKLRPSDFDDDLDALWDAVCLLPQFDQDSDGLGDQCDLCEFDFDPENQPFIDLNNRVWPNAGKFCNGEFSVDNKPSCGDTSTDPTGGEDTEGSASSTGMEMTGGASTG